MILMSLFSVPLVREPNNNARLSLLPHKPTGRSKIDRN